MSVTCIQDIYHCDTCKSALDEHGRNCRQMCIRDRYSPLRKEYIQDLHYNFSTSSLDKPVAPIINSVGEPTCFK